MKRKNVMGWVVVILALVLWVWANAGSDNCASPVDYPSASCYEDAPWD